MLKISKIPFLDYLYVHMLNCRLLEKEAFGTLNILPKKKISGQISDLFQFFMLLAGDGLAKCSVTT